MRIAKFLISIVIGVSLYSCSNNNQEKQPKTNSRKTIEKKYSDSIMNDSNYKKKEPIQRIIENSPTSAPLHSHPSTNMEAESDNMRGFDPISEDDMDDNGMSRFIENDDEEGWE
ncbi:MAG: hypothetical protein IJV27_13125 [Prevotella sp.]|nr:hypothetical protein [Prevotella sp.]